MNSPVPRPDEQRRRRVGTAVIGLGVLGVVGLLVWPRLPSAAGQKPKFFRLQVGLSHKGLPIDFDVVVGCGVRVQSHGYNGTSVEIMALYPLVYAKPIAGGHAVKVRTLPVIDGYDICQNGGTSDNGAVPSVWMPFVTWYDKADDLSHGIGYATLDAYANPNSQLEYHGARISAATKQDFDGFMANAPPNLVPAYNAGWMTVLDRPKIRSAADLTQAFVADPRTAWRMEEAPVCRGVLRYKLDERQRQIVRRLWPSDRPRIWSLQDWKVQTDLNFDGLFVKPYDRPDLRKWMTPERGELGRRGAPPAIYPTSDDFSLARLNPSTGKDGVFYYDTAIGDAWPKRVSSTVT